MASPGDCATLSHAAGDDMRLKIGTRLFLSNLAVLCLSFAVFGPLLDSADLGLLLIFCLLAAVTGLALTPVTLPWICLRDLRAVQAVISGLKRGDYDIALDVSPEPDDPDDEYELNRLKREIDWMRRSIAMRQRDTRAQADRILALNEALRVEAITDKLTGLYNARYFWRFISGYFEERLRSDQPFAVVILDIDFFKRINDTYGHPGGDQVLEQFSAALLENTRKQDMVARIGGEEFALVLHNITSSETKTYLRRLQAVLREQQIELGEDRRVKITVSIGCYMADPPSHPPGEAAPVPIEAMMKRADDALYWVKNHGRDGMMAWHELDDGYRQARRKLEV